MSLRGIKDYNGRCCQLDKEDKPGHIHSKIRAGHPATDHTPFTGAGPHSQEY